MPSGDKIECACGHGAWRNEKGFLGGRNPLLTFLFQKYALLASQPVFTHLRIVWGGLGVDGIISLVGDSEGRLSAG